LDHGRKYWKAEDAVKLSNSLLDNFTDQSLLPQQVEPSLHDVAGARPPPTSMVGHAIFLETVSPAFIAAHTRADLAFPVVVLDLVDCQAALPIEFGQKSRHGGTAAVVARPRLHRSHGAGRNMPDPCGGLHLVAVLPAGAGPAVKFDAEILFPPSRPRRTDHLWIRRHDHRDGYRAGMNAAAPFRWRNPLNAVAAGFVVEKIEMIAFDENRKAMVPGARIRGLAHAGLSPLAVGQLQIGLGQFGDEQTGIAAAFCRADL